MLICLHVSIKFNEEYQEDMHCQGWYCLECNHLAVGECHHTSWCREDFCGAASIHSGEREPVLSGS